MILPISIQRSPLSRLPKIDFEDVPFGKTFSDHMFVMEFDGEEWVNARVVPFQNLSLSPATSALHYGQAIFEGMKAFRSQDGTPMLFRPEMNAKRLNKSAERLAMPTIDEDMFVEAVKTFVAIDQDWIPPHNETDCLYIRPVMFATDDFIGVRASFTYTFLIFGGPVGAYYNQPLSVKISDHYVRAIRGGVGFAKAAGNYAASMMPAQQAKKEGFGQLIWLDGVEHKYIEEAGTMNLFFVIDGVLTTPVAEGSILEGITRDSILTLAHDMNIPVEVKRISINEIVEASHKGLLHEAFGAGTAATITTIININYLGWDLKLKPAEEQTISKSIYQRLVSIRTGKWEDTFNWTHRIESLVVL